jgi:hypothetical protein
VLDHSRHRRIHPAEPANGITDSEHFVFRADGVEYVGPPTELNESDRVEWVPLSEIRGMIDRREIFSSASLLGLRRSEKGSL